MTRHGGELDSAIATYGGRRDKWLDLSTGITHSPYPFMGVPRSDYARLPDSSDYALCREAASRAWSVSPSSDIVFGAGSQAIIQTLPYLFDSESVAIVGFTYSEHGICWSRAGHEVLVSDSPDTAESTARIIIIVNPNNPDGKLHDGLGDLSRRLSMKGGILIVDEAFGDLVPDSSLASQVDDNIIVLRSLGKFFGLAGLRLGAAISTAKYSKQLRERLGPWSVSVPALAAGTKALSDTKWQSRARTKLEYARKSLEEVLTEANLTILGGTDLFVLCEHPRASLLAEHLARHHILVRTYSERPTWLRFGVPAKRGRLNRLLRVLALFGG